MRHPPLTNAPELASGDRYFPATSSQLTPPRGPAAGLPKMGEEPSSTSRQLTLPTDQRWGLPKGVKKPPSTSCQLTPPHRPAAGLPPMPRSLTPGSLTCLLLNAASPHLHECPGAGHRGSLLPRYTSCQLTPPRGPAAGLPQKGEEPSSTSQQMTLPTDQRWGLPKGVKKLLHELPTDASPPTSRGASRSSVPIPLFLCPSVGHSSNRPQPESCYSRAARLFRSLISLITVSRRTPSSQR